jgi:hypothetical protein
MSRRRRYTDWAKLRFFTESSLNQSGEFSVEVCVKGKIAQMESGLYHQNYRFMIDGQGLARKWKEKHLLLRLISQGVKSAVDSCFIFEVVGVKS